MNKHNLVLDFLAGFKKVHLYCADPGAYAVMVALSSILSKSNIAHSLYCDGWAQNNCAQAFIKMSDTVLDNISEKDLLALGSQVDFSITYHYLQVAKERGIKTVFIFDHWKNYIEHFTNNLTKPLLLPDFIFFPDSECKDAFENSLPCEQKISFASFVTGHFAIQELLDTIQNFSLEKIEKFKSQFCSPKQNILLILLDPETSNDNFGFQLSLNLKAMHRDILAMEDAPCVLIKPHPRQDIPHLANALEEWDANSVPFQLLPSNLPLPLLLSVSDKVWGITTMGLVVAKLLGKSIRSYQVGRNNFGLKQSNTHIEAHTIIE